MQPIFNLMYDDLLEQPVIGCDETSIQVLKESIRKPENKSSMWVTIGIVSDPTIINLILADNEDIFVYDGQKIVIFV